MNGLVHLRAFALRPVVAVLTVMALASSVAATSANISGIIYTLDSNHVQTVWPNARVTLKNTATHSEVSTVSSDLGAYTFSGVLFGEYVVTVTLAGFDPVTKHLAIDSDKPAKLDFQLTLKSQTQNITVSADAPTVDLSSSSGGTPTLTATTLKSVIELNQDFQDALPLLPGVVRGFDGLIRIKGGRTNQANTLVNSASVTD
ncbi:MAG TPA: carboxypeptidase-like regulatory domain-containing protein, partial [Terriglobales bacterium]